MLVGTYNVRVANQKFDDGKRFRRMWDGEKWRGGIAETWPAEIYEPRSFDPGPVGWYKCNDGFSTTHCWWSGSNWLYGPGATIACSGIDFDAYESVEFLPKIESEKAEPVVLFDAAAAERFIKNAVAELMTAPRVATVTELNLCKVLPLFEGNRCGNPYA